MPKSKSGEPVSGVPGVLGSEGDARTVSTSLREETLRQMGIRLRDIVNERRISYYVIAVETDIPSSTIRNWLRGRHLPSADNLKKIARYLKVDESVLVLGGKSDGKSGRGER